MNINDFDTDFATYVSDEATQKKLGQVFTPYYIIKQMMDKAGLVSDKNSIWYDETRTNLDPTMGAGNIVIGMLYRRIVECGQNPIIALSNVYGVELDKKTLEKAKERIYNFMDKVDKLLNKNFTDQEWKTIREIIFVKSKESKYPNFVCSDIFDWNIEKWRPYTPAEKDALEQKKKREKTEQTAKVETDWADFE